jgi:Domain of unknown function (DUF5666)
MTLRTFVAAAAIAALATAAAAQDGTPQRIRGTIDSLNGDTLTVTSGDGERFTVALTSETRISAPAARSLEDIVPGTFLASAGDRRADGRIYAVEVRIFPQGLANARQFDYDLGPNSVMTNAPVAEVASVSEGNLVKVTLPEGVVEYVIGPDVPIFVQETADRSVLVPGAYVVINATKMPDGNIVGRNILAEKNGLRPGN